MQLRAGTRLGTYEIVDLLGAGGMGEVYRARDVRLGRLVALKVLASGSTRDPQFAQRFEEEARSACVLNHPNIVTIYGVGEEGDVAFIAMELVEGRTLREILAAGPLPIGDAVDTAVQLAEALAVAHDAGIVHRDLKPENVVVTEDGVAKVLDFGLAKRQTALEGSIDGSDETRLMLTAHGVILGTVGYMSPEQASGRPAGPAADQFALGVVLYEMLAGRRAFDRASTVETLHAIIRDQPQPIGNLPPDAAPILDQVLARCLAKNPGDRYSNTRDLAADLRIARDRSGGARRFASVVARSASGVSRRHAIWIGGAAAVVTAAGIAGWALWPRTATMAVLPFTNREKDADVDYLCDGITESLIQRISRLSSLTVKARSTVFNFKDAAIPPAEAGRRLGVGTILIGSVARRGTQLFITAELVDVKTGNQIWFAKYDRPAADVLVIQEEIAKKIVDEGIHVRLTAEDRRRLAVAPTKSTQAYDQFLRARQLQLRNNEEDYLKARAILEQVVAADPDFAQAHISLGATYGLMAVDGYERPAQAWPQSHQSAQRALDLDPGMIDGRLAMATESFFFKWDWPGAEAEFESALGSGGAFEVEVLRARALERWALGRFDEAIAIARQARALDPISPAYVIMEADFLMHAGQLDAAAALYETVVRQEPNDAGAVFGLAEVRRRQRRWDEALAQIRRGHEITGDLTPEALHAAPGEEGFVLIEQAASRVQLQDLRARAAQGRYASPLDYARAYAVLGEREKALGYFEAAFDDRATGLVFLNVDRAWDSVRDDPRFRAAVRRVGLP